MTASIALLPRAAGVRPAEEEQALGQVHADPQSHHPSRFLSRHLRRHGAERGYNDLRLFKALAGKEAEVSVFLMADGFIGHMREQVVIPESPKIQREERKVADSSPTVLERNDFLDPEVAPMPVFGRGLKAHVTSSCHDAHGMRNLSDPAIMHNYVVKTIEKIQRGRDEIVETVSEGIEDARIALVAYGTVSRCGRAAAQLARAEGIAVGTLRMVSCWPFADREIRELAEKVDAILVLENNTGQLFPYVKAEAAHACRVHFLGPETLGQIHDPEYILKTIKEISA